MRLDSFGAKVADDGARVADGNLDVRFAFDACAIKGGDTFLKNSAHRLECAAFVLLDGGNCGVEHEAISVTFEPIEIASPGGLIFRQCFALGTEDLDDGFRRVREQICGADIKQIEAVAERDDGSENCGLFDFAAFALGLLPRPFLGACRSVLPKVDAVAEPVVVVLAGEELFLSCEDGIGYTAVAAVECEDCALV